MICVEEEKCIYQISGLMNTRDELAICYFKKNYRNMVFLFLSKSVAFLDGIIYNPNDN